MYYPKSQIKTNLYTNGGEYILSTTQEEYIGFLHHLSNGKFYTGKSPNDPPTLLLQPITTNLIIYSGEQENFLPNEIQPLPLVDSKFLNTPTQRKLPTPTQTLPTQQDKDLGVFSRYFCKKNNENIYIEINKEQYIKFNTKDKTVAWDLYTPKQVLWQIKGDKTQTYNANKNNISLIEQRDKWYGFTQYFKDRFLKYYLES